MYIGMVHESLHVAPSRIRDFFLHKRYYLNNQHMRRVVGFLLCFCLGVRVVSTEIQEIEPKFSEISQRFANRPRVNGTSPRVHKHEKNSTSFNRNHGNRQRSRNHHWKTGNDSISLSPKPISIDNDTTFKDPQRQLEFLMKKLFHVIPLQDLTLTGTTFVPLSKEELKAIADKNYPLFIECLQNSNHGTNKIRDFANKLKFPDDAEEHYQDLLRRTKSYRGIYMHKNGDYVGPWIENFYIESFMNKPLSFFSGLIPLFIQWTDIHVHSFTDPREVPNITYAVPDHTKMPWLISDLLRDDVIYVTLHQDDQGFYHDLAKLRPNILAISSGGFGHIPIPLIKGQFELAELPQKFEYDIGFYGTPRMSRERLASSVFFW